MSLSESIKGDFIHCENYKANLGPSTSAAAAPANIIKRQPPKINPSPNIESSFGGLADDDEAEDSVDGNVQDGAQASGMSSKVSLG